MIKIKSESGWNISIKWTQKQSRRSKCNLGSGERIQCSTRKNEVDDHNSIMKPLKDKTSEQKKRSIWSKFNLETGKIMKSSEHKNETND